MFFLLRLFAVTVTVINKGKINLNQCRSLHVQTCRLLNYQAASGVSNQLLILYSVAELNSLYSASYF